MSIESPVRDALARFRMALGHLDGAVALSRAEGWPHRVEDWTFILSRSQGVVALKEGWVVATAVATPFGSVATMNMILMLSVARRQARFHTVCNSFAQICGSKSERIRADSRTLPMTLMASDGMDRLARWSRNDRSPQ